MALSEKECKAFIETFAPLVQKYAPQFDIVVASAIIAQACLESNYGTSDKVVSNGDWRHNYLGLKWRDKRCAVSNEYFEEHTAEQNPDGSYKNIVSKFCRFKSMEDCVLGYFQWTNIPNYQNLKGVTDPKKYLENIKADKYATSIDYVDKVMNVVNKWNLTQYDNFKEADSVTIKVAIDAGHGSETSGKRHPDGYREHYSNTYTAFYLDQILRANGFQTYKSSWNDNIVTDDADVALAKRQSDIKSAKCDISVSIHANASGSGSTYNTGAGIETYYHSSSTNAKNSKKLAESVHSQLIKGTTQKNRGVKTANFAMCNCTALGVKAAILVEEAFMTNLTESNLLKSDAYMRECAKEIAQGIFNYCGVNGNVNINLSPAKSEKSNSKNTAGSQSDCPFIVQCLDDLNIRFSAGGPIKVQNGCKKGIKYTIVKVEGNWGYLKSGAGWISILNKYVKKS